MNYFCKICNKQISKPQVNRAKYFNKLPIFCSTKCRGLLSRKRVVFKCLICNKQFERPPSQISNNNFCSHSCAATYHNTHKIKGYQRSKLEKWLELQLPILYPNLEFKFNSIKEINSELDIYIPTLKLAFELNGLFHYEPIFSQDKLNKTQNNDKRKFQACLENNIELCIIDVSKIKYFKESTSKPILEVIKNIINQKLSS